MSLIRNKTLIRLTILFLLFIASSLFYWISQQADASETGSTMAYQGFITNADGTPLSGAQDFQFQLFATDIDTTVLWTESHTAVMVADGLFNVTLGSKIEIPHNAWQNQTAYLQITLNGETLSPRTRVTLEVVTTSRHKPTPPSKSLRIYQGLSILTGHKMM